MASLPDCQGLFSDSEIKAAKRKLIDDAIAAASRKMNSLTEYSREEMEIQPWKKTKLLKEQLWRQHTEAVTHHVDDWEKKVLDTFKSKCIAKALTPLMAMIGQYLIFYKDVEQGRRELLELLYLQNDKSRLETHNWRVLSFFPPGSDETYGDKIKELNVPLFPPADTDLNCLNTGILNSVGTVAGGDWLTDHFSHTFELSGGDASHWIPIVNAHGEASPEYKADASLIAEAMAGSVQRVDAALAHFRDQDNNLWQAVFQLRKHMQRLYKMPQIVVRGTVNQKGKKRHNGGDCPENYQGGSQLVVGNSGN